MNRFTDPGRAHAPLSQPICMREEQRRPFPSPLLVIQYNAFLTLTPNFILNFFAAADPPSTLRIASIRVENIRTQPRERGWDDMRRRRDQPVDNPFVLQRGKQRCDKPRMGHLWDPWLRAPS